jgi:hypothetical protein
MTRRRLLSAGPPARRARHGLCAWTRSVAPFILMLAVIAAVVTLEWRALSSDRALAPSADEASAAVEGEAGGRTAPGVEGGPTRVESRRSIIEHGNGEHRHDGDDWFAAAVASEVVVTESEQGSDAEQSEESDRRGVPLPPPLRASDTVAWTEPPIVQPLSGLTKQQVQA